MKMKLGLYGKKKKTNEETVDEGMMSTVKAKVLPILTGGSDKDLLKKLQKDMGVPQTGQKPATPVKEASDVFSMNKPIQYGLDQKDASDALEAKRKKQMPQANMSDKQQVAAPVNDTGGITFNKRIKENKDTPGNSYEHQCAVHVKSESFGEGRTITTQHANPDADGNIEWYDVMFEHGIEKQVPTSTLEILVSEMHMHSKKKKKMM